MPPTPGYGALQIFYTDLRSFLPNGAIFQQTVLPPNSPFDGAALFVKRGFSMDERAYVLAIIAAVIILAVQLVRSIGRKD